jgi:hypothetical protein
MIACLKGVGKEFSRRQRLSKLVIGMRSASRHFLRRNVGMVSRMQEELLEERIRRLTSSGVVGEKDCKGGGVAGGGKWGGKVEGLMEAESLNILS